MTPILLFFFFTLVNANAKYDDLMKLHTIEAKVLRYFTSQEFQYFKKIWETLRPSYENAIATTIKDTFGSKAGSMNLYILRKQNPQNLQRGYVFTDNVVNVVLQNLYLRELPRLYTPDVSFPFHHNVIRVESLVAKLFADSDYVVFRNKSDIVYDGDKQINKNAHSPFSFEQVTPDGTLTIIGQDCHLVGQAVVTLSGLSVHVGHTTFKLSSCKFSIEIYQPNFKTPPVIAPYFTEKQAVELERVLSTALNEEMQGALEGILLSHMNTTAFFGENMPRIRRKQTYLFQDSSDYFDKVASLMNTYRLQNGGNAIENIKGTSFSWDQSIQSPGQSQDARLELTDITMNGLDRLYHSNKGGPIVTGEYQIMDQFRYEKLQVRGQLKYDSSNVSLKYNFSVELQDVEISVKVKLHIPNEGKKEPKRRMLDETEDKKALREGDEESYEDSADAQPLTQPDSPYERPIRLFKVTGWRFLEFSSNDLDVYTATGLPTYAFITGYLVSEIPKTLQNNLIGDFKKALGAADRISIGSTFVTDSDVTLEKMNKTKRAKKKAKGHKLTLNSFY